MKVKDKFLKYSWKGWNVNHHTENLSELYISWCFQQVGLECLPHKKAFMDAETLLEKGHTTYNAPLTNDQIWFLKSYIELFYQVQKMDEYNG
jgi:hypothetical protein